MNISEAADFAGLPAKTIRYYEEIGLVCPARAANGYRDYAKSDIETLRFLANARNLGFSIEDCRHLLSLYRDKDRASADVRALTKERMAEIDEKIASLQAMKDTLDDLVRNCRGDARPDCPILQNLAGRA
ncbi:Cu(I)-responsive transcriptional regulator [Tepidamorphus sp. 3E244]|uniref:Cu(I)-responsive transcriptional regulator n=1 Tax=Tepidamorphus sp. 3E244 TaxID=3385498 RepID=UPI0038FC2345